MNKNRINDHHSRNSTATTHPRIGYSYIFEMCWEDRNVVGEDDDNNNNNYKIHRSYVKCGTETLSSCASLVLHITHSLIRPQ